MAQPLSEFHKTLQNNYTTCSKSHCELSMQMNYECRNANCLKIVWKKNPISLDTSNIECVQPAL